MQTKKGIKMLDMLETNYSVKSAMNALHIDFFDLMVMEEVLDHITIERIELKNYLDQTKKMIGASGNNKQVNYLYTIPVDDYLDLGLYKISYGYRTYSEDKFINDGKRIYWINENELWTKWAEIERIFLAHRRDFEIEKIIGND